MDGTMIYFLYNDIYSKLYQQTPNENVRTSFRELTLKRKRNMKYKIMTLCTDVILLKNYLRFCNGQQCMFGKPPTSQGGNLYTNEWTKFLQFHSYWKPLSEGLAEGWEGHTRYKSSISNTFCYFQILNIRSFSSINKWRGVIFCFISLNAFSLSTFRT